MKAGIELLRSFRRGAKDTGAVAALKDIVKGDDPKFSALAADALAKIDPPVKKPPALYDARTFTQWKSQLVEKKPERIAEVVTALGVLGAEDEKSADEAAPLIMKMAMRHWSDNSVAGGQVRSAAIDAYQRILFSPEAANRLIDGLKNGDRKAQSFGVDVLHGIQDTKSKELPKLFDRKSAIDGLIAVSKNDDATRDAYKLRYILETAAALDRNNDQLQARLVESLQGDDPEIVKMCMQILVEAAPDTEGLVDRLTQLAKQPKSSVRAQAIYELGRLHRDAKKVVPVLLALVTSKDRKMFESVTLRTFHFTDHVPIDTNHRFRKDSARRVAIQALGKYGADAAEAVPVLQKLLEIGLSSGTVADRQSDIRPCTTGEFVTLFNTLAKIGAPAKGQVDLMKLRLSEISSDSRFSGIVDEMQEAITKLEKDADGNEN